jgi:hypothetical protein
MLSQRKGQPKIRQNLNRQYSRSLCTLKWAVPAGSDSPSKISMGKGRHSTRGISSLLHIRQGQLSKIERGIAAPGMEVLILLSDRFRKSIDWILLSGEGN